MTFAEFVRAYANYYGSKGEGWLQEYVLDCLEAGMSDYTAVQAVCHELTAEMAEKMAQGEIAEYGYAWSKRDRLRYMLIDWDRYESTGEKYF